MALTGFSFPHSRMSSSLRSLPIFERPKRDCIFSEVSGVKGHRRTEIILSDSTIWNMTVDKTLAAGIQSDFIDEVGNIVAFTQFDTFKLVVDSQLLDGNYKIVASEGENTIEMIFNDGTVETWSIMITEGKVTALVDDEGTQYTQKDQLEVERQIED